MSIVRHVSDRAGRDSYIGGAAIPNRAGGDARWLGRRGTVVWTAYAKRREAGGAMAHHAPPSQHDARPSLEHVCGRNLDVRDYGSPTASKPKERMKPAKSTELRRITHISLTKVSGGWDTRTTARPARGSSAPRVTYSSRQ